MRKGIGLLLLSGALVLGGCDDDDTSSPDAGPNTGMDSGNGGIQVPDSQAQQPIPFPECERDDIQPPPTWDLDNDGEFDEAPFTREMLDACLDACPMLSDMCIDTSAACTGFDDFDFCVRLAAGECASQPGSSVTCYDEWQDYTCCIEAECPGAMGDALTTCIQDNCIDYASGYFDCIFANDACIGRGITQCAPGDPAGMDDGGTDGGDDLSCSCECECMNETVPGIECIDTAANCCDAICAGACAGDTRGGFVSATRTCESTLSASLPAASAASSSAGAILSSPAQQAVSVEPQMDLLRQSVQRFR